MLVTTKLAKLSSIDCTKSQTFSNSCAQNRHSLLAKIVQHINGTSGAERGSSADPTLERYALANL